MSRHRISCVVLIFFVLVTGVVQGQWRRPECKEHYRGRRSTNGISLDVVPSSAMGIHNKIQIGNAVELFAASRKSRDVLGFERPTSSNWKLNRKKRKTVNERLQSHEGRYGKYHRFVRDVIGLSAYPKKMIKFGLSSSRVSHGRTRQIGLSARLERSVSGKENAVLRRERRGVQGSSGLPNWIASPHRQTIGLASVLRRERRRERSLDDDDNDKVYNEFIASELTHRMGPYPKKFEIGRFMRSLSDVKGTATLEKRIENNAHSALRDYDPGRYRRSVSGTANERADFTGYGIGVNGGQDPDGSWGFHEEFGGKGG